MCYIEAVFGDVINGVAVAKDARKIVFVYRNAFILCVRRKVGKCFAKIVAVLFSPLLGVASAWHTDF